MPVGPPGIFTSTGATIPTRAGAPTCKAGPRKDTLSLCTGRYCLQPAACPAGPLRCGDLGIASVAIPCSPCYGSFCLTGTEG